MRLQHPGARNWTSTYWTRINMHIGLIQQLNNFFFAQDNLIRAGFYLIAGLTVFFSLRVVISRNIFHSAIFLALALLGVACAYLYLDAEFLAIAQILIYVGAVVTLFIFVIMLTASIQDRSIRQANEQVLVSALGALAFLFLFLRIIIKKNDWQSASPAMQGLSIEQLGRSLMTNYVLPFEIISVILTAVLVGAIIIAKTDKK